MAKHQDLSSPYAIHPFAYSSNADPANDGSIDTTPYKGWINTGNSNLLKVRNAADSAWEDVSVAGAATTPAFGSNSTSVTTYNDNAGTLASANAHHHIGVTSLAHSSNTFSGPVTLTTPGNTVGITSPGTGQLAFTAAAAAGGGAGSYDGTRTEATLSGDVTLVTPDTFYDGPTITPAAGTYDVWARVTVAAIATGQMYAVGRLIANGSATPIDEAQVQWALVNTSQVAIILSARVTANGVNPILVRTAASNANMLMKRNPLNNSSGVNRATLLVLIKVS